MIIQERKSQRALDDDPHREKDSDLTCVPSTSRSTSGCQGRDFRYVFIDIYGVHLRLEATK